MHVKLYYNYKKENKNPNLAVITQNFNKRMEMIGSKIIGQTKNVFLKKNFLNKGYIFSIF